MNADNTAPISGESGAHTHEDTHTHTHSVEPIATNPGELAALVEYWSRRGLWSDAESARRIYDSFMTGYAVPGSPAFTFDRALGSIFRIGYALGQTREREQNNFERGLKIGAALTEYMNEGGSLSELVELIKRAKAENTHLSAAHSEKG